MPLSLLRRVRPRMQAKLATGDAPDPDRQPVYFGIKMHIGVGSKTGLTHSVSITSANVHGSQEWPNHCMATIRLYGDSACTGQKGALKRIASKAKDFTNKRASRNTPPTEKDKETNRRESQIHTKVEHLWIRQGALPWPVKNANHAFAFFALINLDKWGSPLTGRERYVQREQNAAVTSGMKPAGLDRDENESIS